MDCRPMALSNMNRCLSRISSLLEWSVKNGFIKTNFAEVLQIKRNIPSDQEGSPYKYTQLQKVFSHLAFTKSKYKHPFQYWLPL